MFERLYEKPVEKCDTVSPHSLSSIVAGKGAEQESREKYIHTCARDNRQTESMHYEKGENMQMQQKSPNPSSSDQLNSDPHSAPQTDTIIGARILLFLARNLSNLLSNRYGPAPLSLAAISDLAKVLYTRFTMLGFVVAQERGRQIIGDEIR